METLKFAQNLQQKTSDFKIQSIFGKFLLDLDWVRIIDQMDSVFLGSRQQRRAAS